MKVLYFAWLRAKIGRAGEELVPPPEVTTVGAFLDWLATRGPGYAEALADASLVRVAVNHEYVDREHVLAGGDEVALFPPVTGG